MVYEELYKMKCEVTILRSVAIYNNLIIIIILLYVLWKKIWIVCRLAKVILPCQNNHVQMWKKIPPRKICLRANGFTGDENLIIMLVGNILRRRPSTFTQSVSSFSTEFYRPDCDEFSARNVGLSSTGWKKHLSKIHISIYCVQETVLYKL